MREAIRRPTGTACWIFESSSSRSSKASLLGPISLDQSPSAPLPNPLPEAAHSAGRGFGRVTGLPAPLGRKNPVPRGLQKLTKF